MIDGNWQSMFTRSNVSLDIDPTPKALEDIADRIEADTAAGRPLSNVTTALLCAVLCRRVAAAEKEIKALSLNQAARNLGHGG